MKKDLIASRTDRTARIPFSVASPLTTNHAARGSVFCRLKKYRQLLKMVHPVQGQKALEKLVVKLKTLAAPGTVAVPRPIFLRW